MKTTDEIMKMVEVFTRADTDCNGGENRMRALLEQALTALVQCTYDEEGYLLNPDNEAAIEAIRAELAKPEQEPVAWVHVIDRNDGPYNFFGQELLDAGTGGFGSTGGGS